MIDLLAGTPLDNRQRRFTDACAISAKSLLGLITDILDFSKIEAGKLVLANDEFELDLVIEDTMRMLGLRAQEKNLELICSIDPAVMWLVSRRRSAVAADIGQSGGQRHQVHPQRRSGRAGNAAIAVRRKVHRALSK